MTETNRAAVVVGVIIVVVVAILAFLLSRGSAPASNTTGTTTPSSATTTTITLTPVSPNGSITNINPLPIDARDTIKSWSLGSPSSAAVTQAKNNMTELQTQLGKGTYQDYDMYVGIGEDYELMGDGQNAYNSFVHAEETNTTSGLAYNDIGNLMAELGAFNTACEAFAKAIATEPKIEGYQLAYVQFLARYTPSSPGVQAAFTTALGAFPNDTSILSAEAQWYLGQGATANALATFEKLLPLVATSSQPAIQAEISRLSQ